MLARAMLRRPARVLSARESIRVLSTTSASSTASDGTITLGNVASAFSSMITGSLQWAIGGGLAGYGAAHALGAAGLLINAGAATTALAGASVLCLGPVGFARAASNAAEDLLLEPIGAAVGAGVNGLAGGAGAGESLSLGEAEAMIRALAVPGRGGGALKDTLHTTGPTGTVVRLAMSVFLPRTDFMLDHIVREVNRSAAGQGGGGGGGGGGTVSATALRDVSVGAAKGLVAATTDDVRSKVTALGILAFAVAGGGAVLVMDRAERAYREKKAALDAKKAAVRARVDSVKAAADDAKARAAETAGRAGKAVDRLRARASEMLDSSADEKKGGGDGEGTDEADSDGKMKAAKDKLAKAWGKRPRWRREDSEK